MSPLKQSAIDGGRYINGSNTSITFNADGTVTYVIGTDPPVTENLETFAPNGTIIVDGADLRIKGVLNGRVTVGALTGGVSGAGDVFLDDDITYAGDPNDPECDDMLGIVADDDILVADNANNNNSINIHASMFSRTGGFGAENYSTRGKDGTINLVGGIQQYQRGAVGTFGGGGITSGFYKNYRYDNRLLADLPPFYPTTGSYEIVSWYE
jgi:hypothetical protein